MIISYINDLINRNELPGAVLYVSKNGELKIHQAFGSFTTRDNQKLAVSKSTIFDTASLTKVLVTLPTALLLQSLDEISLNDPVQAYVKSFRHPDITIQNLLQHNSGLPADLTYQERYSRRNVIEEVLQTDLQSFPGTKTTYSDLGMILLGHIIEKITETPLHKFVYETIFKPWGLTNTSYLLSEKKKQQAASTEWDGDGYIQGDVHDEKAFQMGGVSGSAGIFTTAMDVAKYAQYWLYPEQQNVISPELMMASRKHIQDNRGLGFQVWSGKGEPLACGPNWSIGSFGHTGFTGTSVWVDPSQKLVSVFLTNAVHYGRNTNIKQIRKDLHTLIYSSFN